MTIINTKELTGAALDLAVAMANGCGFEVDESEVWITVDGIATLTLEVYTPSSDWRQGGPIIEREKINLHFIGKFVVAEKSTLSLASVGLNVEGDTALIAAMRCYVASKLGETVEIPDEVQS